MVQMKRLNTRELSFAMLGTILVLATLGTGSALAQGAAPGVPAPAGAPAAPAPAGAPGPPAIPAGVVPPPGYVIGPEDALSVVFWREKDMSTEAAVRPDGMITVPLLNDIHAAGLTPDQLRERIQTAAAKFVEDPTVTVVVKAINSRKVFITGLVSKPGQYPLAGPTSVMQLIAMAGGLQEYANSKKILIMRTEGGEQVAKPFNYQDVLNRKNLKQNIDLLPGDTVIIP
jgi:polysaccharide export outer membrane protein